MLGGHDEKLNQDDMHLEFYRHSEYDDVKKPQEKENLDNLGDHEREEGEEEEEGDEDEEFSFICGGEEDGPPIAAEDAFANGPIKQIFPLFNRDLLFSGDDYAYSSLENLPSRPPVKKVFLETKEEKGETASSAPGNDEISGPYCEWSSRKAVEASREEACKKSNSTGFSKIWRFKEFVGRCNSDGRDAFVFLNNAHPPPAAKKPADSTAEKNKVKVERKVKKGGTSKPAPLSAHEVYLRSKAKEEERRRSYLPYRAELVGFFTNVNGGLTKNVHPF